MYFKKYKEIGCKKRIMLISGIGMLLLVTIVLMYRSYAIYQENHDFNVIHGSVPEYMDHYDVELSVMIDGNYSKTFPEKNSGKAVSSISCNKGASASWDYKNWSIHVLNVSETRTKCQINFETKYTESILNGTDPVLADGLIPVTIGENGEVKKASLGSEWYKYSDKKWANAVILEDEYIVYAEGEEIPEDNIESYFVWIPRYKYKIFNNGNYTGLTSITNGVKTIEIEFENKEQSISIGSKVGTWLTHPAFTSFDVNGMWVGKFETGFKGATNRKGAQSDTNDSGNVVIKPNVYSWREISVANAFTASYNYRRSMDSHMMKNTEWGAVVYLQHSAYGSQQSVRINNNSAYITGYASKKEPTCGYTTTNEDCNKYESTAIGADGTYTVNYNNNESVVASTTGNRSGIYDMSGGSWEYVMGVMLSSDNKTPCAGRDSTSTSGFAGPYCNTTGSASGEAFPESKYYDTYVYGIDDEHYNRRILGDATGEMGSFANVTYGTQTRQIGSWYADEAWFVSTGYPWFNRGNGFSRGSGAGALAFGNNSGTPRTPDGFRLVLAI